MVVRTDLSVPEQACQAIHAAHEAARHFYFDNIPVLVFLQVPGECELLAVRDLMRRHRVKHILFREPDFDDIPTSVATGPLRRGDRKWFSSYPLWRCSSDGRKQSAHPSGREVDGSSPSTATMLPLP